MNNMRTLAENTGGLAFVGGSDLSRSVRELVEDNSSFYVLGYYPQPFERDGKFHDVKVSVKRPGAHVRARAGYEAPKATPDGSGGHEADAGRDARRRAAGVGLVAARVRRADVRRLHGMKTP